MALDLSQFDLPFSEIEDKLRALVTEGLSLRFDPEKALTFTIASPKTVLESLIALRGRLDRLEELVAIASRAKGRATRAAAEAARVARERWDAASVQARSGAARRREDFTGAKEHYADYNLATLNEQRGAFQAERLADFASETLEVLKLIHRGLDNYRADHLAIIRSLSFESHLERTTTDRGF